MTFTGSDVIQDRGPWDRLRKYRFNSKFISKVVVLQWVEEGNYLGIEWKRHSMGNIYLFGIEPYIHIFNNLHFNDYEYKGKTIHYWCPGVYFVCDNIVWEKIIERIHEYRLNFYKPGGKMYRKSEKRVTELSKN